MVRRLGPVVLIWAILVGRSAADADPPPPPAYVRPPPATLSLPSSAGDHKLKFTTRIAGRAVTLSYLLRLPPASAAGGRPPVLVFFHGIGECGTDLAGVYSPGPMTVFHDGRPLAASCPFAVLCPQCPPRGEQWSDDRIYQACDERVAAVVHSAHVDADRVYATGLSMGGLGTWCAAEAAPDLYAAVVPMSAVTWHPEAAGGLLRYVTAWTLTGLSDEPRFVDGNRAMEQALAGGPMPDRFTYFDDGHRVFEWAYASPQLYEWMLTRRRPTPADRRRLPASRPASSPPSPLPAKPGHYWLTTDATLNGNPVPLDYSLYIPRPAAGRQPHRPGMLFLHERDTIGPDFAGLSCHGPDLAVERHHLLQDSFPFVVVSPRLPLRCDWDTPGLSDAVSGLIDHVTAELSLDPDRVVISGVDAGATAAWRMAAAHPDRFAAVTWVDTRPDVDPPEGRLPGVLPGRAFVATAGDPGRLRRLAEQFKAAKAGWQFVPMAAGTAPLGELSAYTDRATIAWLAQQRRRPRP